MQNGSVTGMADHIVKAEWRGDYTKYLILNRPDRANAINGALILRLTEEIVKCYSDQTKILIIQGEGKHFCSGFDREPSKLESTASRSLLGIEIESMLQILAGAPCVTLAYIHGAAVGAGADIAVACDYRCATSDATIAFPGFNLIGASLGNSRLSQRIGPDQAMRLILLAHRVGVEEAFQMGLITNIVEADEITLFITELEAALEKTSKPALRSLKKSVGEISSRAFGSTERSSQAMDPAI